MRSPGKSAFAARFRERLFQYVEYSVEEDPGRLGTMIFGDGDFLDDVARFLPPFSGAEDWLRALRRFCSRAKPVNYLLKVDWREETIVAVSIYCRFIENINAKALADALADAPPLVWQGPPIEDIARAVGTSWPHGMGFRITAEGRHHAAIYNRVSMPSLDFRIRALPDLVALCGFPDAVQRAVRCDMTFVYGPGPVGVVGVDGGRDGRAAALKLDAEAVPLSWVMRFAAARGTALERIEQIASLARSLSLRSAGYFGLKYGMAGFESWKLYLPIQPRLRRAASATRLDINRWATSGNRSF